MCLKLLYVLYHNLYGIIIFTLLYQSSGQIRISVIFTTAKTFSKYAILKFEQFSFLLKVRNYNKRTENWTEFYFRFTKEY